MEEEINTLQDASRVLGINYIAVWHMTQFGALNETAITEDLSNGLLLEKTLKLTPFRRSKLTPLRRSKLTP